MELVPPRVDYIKLAAFSACECSSLGALQKQHLAVTTLDAELDGARSFAVAISYTWGATNRSEFSLGHYAYEPQRIVTITLGSEWSRPNFSKRLLQLTESYGACWIDQICIEQKEDQIRETLAAIPRIFEILPVVALFPGSLCTCLRKEYDRYQRARAQSAHLQDNHLNSFLLQDQQRNGILWGSSCVSSNGSCSWPSRVWPLQELRYCTSIEVMWTDESPSECYPPIAVHGTWPAAPPPASFYRRLGNGTGLSLEAQIQAMRDKNRQFLHDLMYSLQLDLERDLSDVRDLAFEVVAPFLLCHRIQRKSLTERQNNGLNGLRGVLESCAMLAANRRSATCHSDYVSSVWAEWRRYVPPNCKSWSAFKVLSDALSQCSSHPDMNFTLFVATKCPAGLLDIYGYNSALWSMESGLHSESVEDSTDVYGLFEWLQPFFLESVNQIPLKITGPSTSQANSAILSFQVWSQGQNIHSLKDAFMDCVQFWDWNDRCAKEESVRSTLQDLLSTRPGLTSRVFGSMDVDSIREQTAQTMLGIVCKALHLCVDVCRNNNVHLMFTRREVAVEGNPQNPVPRHKRDVLCVGLVNWKKLALAREEEMSTLTIALRDPLLSRYGNPHYEAVRLGQPPTQHFAVVGIWMPLRHQVQQGGANAYILSERVDGGTPDAWIV